MYWGIYKLMQVTVLTYKTKLSALIISPPHQKMVFLPLKSPKNIVNYGFLLLKRSNSSID